MNTLSGRMLIFTIAAHILFWGWNVLLASFFTLGFGGVVGFELAVATFMGMIPWEFGAFALTITLLPLLTMALGLWKFRSNPGHLLTLLYGVEIPVLVLITVRLFAVHQLTTPTFLALAVTALGSMGLLTTLLRGPREESSALQAARQATQAINLIPALWWGLMAGIYGFALFAGVVTSIPDFLREVARDPFILGYVAHFSFLILTLLVVWLSPFAMLGTSLRSFSLVHRETSAKLGKPAAFGLALTPIVAVLLAFGVTSYQPQGDTLAALESATTDVQRRALLASSAQHRKGLMAARLGPERLLEADADGDHIAQLYRDSLPRFVGTAAQGLWATLMRPFTYHAVGDRYIWSGRQRVPSDVKDATLAYNAFFDTDMRAAERESLVAAARSTWSWDEAAAGVLDAGEERVFLKQQNVDVMQAGDAASVTVHDVYVNHTFDQQEVLLSFSLPESAAVTGLWLGHSADRSKAFTHIVAPRGAAQEVYEREVQRRVDPALLEQVGPRTYRLRAFPVEAREGNPSDIWSFRGEGAEFHLWLEYSTPVAADGAVPTPDVREARNVFWSSDTVRTLDDKSTTSDTWMPAIRRGGSQKQPHTVNLSGHQITATPAVPSQATPRKLALVIDGSRSMQRHAEQIDEAIEQLRSDGVALTVFCQVEMETAPCLDFDATTALFYGNRSMAQQLASAADQAGNTPLMVFTDEGNYAVAGASEASLPQAMELPTTWVVHFGGTPSAYLDWTLDRVGRSGGGFASSLDEALTRMASSDWRDGWVWSVEPTEEADSPRTAFTAMAARQAIGLLDRQGTSELSHLDAMHELAIEASVVTHYSSMIVLVLDRQEQLLKELSEADDRFDREATDSEFSEISAAPEPGTWLLLALGGALIPMARRRRESAGDLDPQG